MIPLYGTSYTTCIGCDITFSEMLNIKKDCIRQTGRVNYTGHNNNTRDTSSSTSTSSTFQSQNTQQQPVSSNTGFIRSNNNVGLIRPSSTSGRHVQSQHFNVSQSNRSNTDRRPNTDRSTISDNTETDTSWINSGDFNSSRNRSDQSASSNANNVTNTWGNIDNNSEIMCHCHEIAIQLTVKKEGPNKGNLAI